MFDCPSILLSEYNILQNQQNMNTIPHKLMQAITQQLRSRVQI